MEASKKESEILKCKNLLEVIEKSRQGIIPITSHYSNQNGCGEICEHTSLDWLSIYPDHEVFDLASNISDDYLENELKFRIDGYLAILAQLQTRTRDKLYLLLKNEHKEA